MTEPPVKVLCITGWCRNGSTIVGNVLNELPGFFHVGELHFLWRNAAGQGANNLCGCGRPLPQCTIWSQILPLGRPAGTSAEAYADVVVARQRAYVRTRHTWRVLRRGLYCDGICEHADLMQQVYRAIAKRTGAAVLVDTNKIPGESALLSHLAGIESIVLEISHQHPQLKPGAHIGVWCATKLATDAGGWRQINRGGYPMMWPIFWPDDTHFTNPANTRHPSKDFDAEGKHSRSILLPLSRPAGPRMIRKAMARP